MHDWYMLGTLVDALALVNDIWDDIVEMLG
jgi:hypothetical protein